MSRLSNAFTIMELVIALALSSFIMLGMIQGYRNAINIAENARGLLSINRRVALLFNQMERDFSTMLAYQALDPLNGKKKEQKKEKKPESVGGNLDSSQAGKTDEEKKKQALKGEDPKKHGDAPDLTTIKSDIYEDEFIKRAGKKWQLTKSVSFLSLSPLEVYGQTSDRYVRVIYELQNDKEKSAQFEKQSYRLVRKQTYAHKRIDAKFKDDEKSDVITHVVAKDIKHFAIEFSYYKKQQKDPKEKPKKNEEREMIKTFTWAEKETRMCENSVPEYATILLSVWDDLYKKATTFEVMVPCFIKYIPASKKKKKSAGKKPESPFFKQVGKLPKGMQNVFKGAPRDEEGLDKHMQGLAQQVMGSLGGKR